MWSLRGKKSGRAVGEKTTGSGVEKAIKIPFSPCTFRPAGRALFPARCLGANRHYLVKAVHLRAIFALSPCLRARRLKKHSQRMGCGASVPSSAAPSVSPSPAPVTEAAATPAPVSGVLGVIPARYGSTRFPGKPLADLAGKPMIWHTYHNAKTSAVLTKLVVATDDERIQKVVEEFGGEVVMTDVNLENGTERCHAVLTQLQSKGERYDVVVNIQGDEPFIEGSHVDEVARVVLQSDAVMGTLARPHIDEADVVGVNNVKVVLDVNGFALYFSRAVIPHNKKGTYDPNCKYWRKLGIYSYRADFLPTYITMPESLLQKAEDLEQNKVIEAGHRIKVGIVNEAVHGVDTPAQLDDLNDQVKKGLIKVPSLVVKS